jgi:alpha-tubulin suppressor-like RCC1 family protein
MSRNNWPSFTRGVNYSYERIITMYSKNNNFSITRLWKNSRLFLFSGLLSLSVALPSFTHAATPWYSHGRSHTLTLTQDGKVWSLGGNKFGEMGIGVFGGDNLEPRLIEELEGVTAALAGGSHSVALKNDGTVWAWGFNGSGQLGDGSTKSSPLPMKVAGLDNVKAIATGSSHIVALKRDGTVWTWGGNRSGQLGNGEYQDCMTPVQVTALKDVTAIAAGAFNTAVLRKDGTVWSWGFNAKGQLGNGGKERSNVPVQVSGLSDVHAIAAGDWHVAALRHDGSVWAWGSNHASQLGTTLMSTSRVPVRIPGLDNIIDITASVGHTIAIAKNRNVWAWGDAGTGQWGNGSSLDGSVTPIQVTGYSGHVNVAAVVNPSTIRNDDSDDSLLQALLQAKDESAKNLAAKSDIFMTASR